MTAKRLIKKYPNRRLYDTERGSYVTLDDIKQLVLDQIEVQIVDAKTQKDLTQSTLLQIIAEQEETMTPVFTKGMLQNLIRFYHQNSQFLLSEFLEQSLQLFTQQKELIKTQWAPFEQFFNDMLKSSTYTKEKSSKKNTKKSSR